MKAYLTLLLLLFLFQVPLKGQSFSEAMELYRAENYEQAANLFIEADDDRSLLFAGKSYMALADYSSAIQYLQDALQSSQENIRDEALFTLAMVHFILNNYDVSLEQLYELASGNNQTGLGPDSQRFYNQILNYMSLEDRYQTLYKLTTPAIQFDLVRSSKPFMESGTYQILVDEFVNITGDSFSQMEIERELRSNPSNQSNRIEYPAPPEGMVYNIGVILPIFDENDPSFTIPRNLYYGMALAADDFNERNRNQKVNLIFKNSAENTDTTAAVFTELAWTKKVSAIIGPLFSEPASKLAQLSEEYRIPMLAPLANSDSLNLDYNYTFQINPTFEVHGKRMARFAVQQLRLDTLAVIIEEGSLGRNTAIAFRQEAERLGANISYFIEEDFASTGYDFSEVTNVFTSDRSLIDSLNYRPTDAIFAPFTGEASTTMMNLLMNNLEAMNSDVTVLGNEEWEYAPLTDYQKRTFDIYYTESYVQDPDSAAMNLFSNDYETRFGSTPDRFSRIGYDTANYLFRSLEIAGNPDYLGRAIRNGSVYNGLAYQIFFDGKRVNQQVFIRSMSE